MTRPRTTEDLEELQLRARLRLERRRRLLNGPPRLAYHHIDGDPTNNDTANLRLVSITQIGAPQSPLVREAAAVVAAIDGMLDEREDNMEAWAHGDR
jgi:hypothetical protein